MPTLEQLRKEFRKQCAKTAGDDGEYYAERWLSKTDWDYEKVEQGKEDLSCELKAYGGKRPDFVVDPKDDKSYLLVDAKYHSTENGTIFRLKDAEIGKYRALVKFSKDKFSDSEFDMVFMVFPKENNGNRFVWVHLDEFDNGEPTSLVGEPATFVCLTDRDTLWCDNP